MDWCEISYSNQGTKHCAKCDMENCIFLAFVRDFMLYEAWYVKKLKVNVTACFSELLIEQPTDPETKFYWKYDTQW